MERFDRRLHVRVGKTDVERAQTLSGALNITTSALVRLLLQLPAEDVEARRHVVLDLVCANRLYRELNQWGYQQNQASRALNRITIGGILADASKGTEEPAKPTLSESAPTAPRSRGAWPTGRRWRPPSRPCART